MHPIVIIALVSAAIITIAGVFIMKKIQPECFWLYLGYVIFLWILEGVFIYFQVFA